MTKAAPLPVLTTADQILNAPGWWYTRLYPGGLKHLDTAVDRVLPTLVDFAAEAGADRWFFIRYTDWDGPHLRVRFHGSRDLLDALHRRLPSLRAECVRLGRKNGDEYQPILPLDLRPFRGHHSGAEVAIYEPENDKYGGPAGTRLAEEVFEHSSDLARWANAYPRVPDRAALAVLLLRGAGEALSLVTAVGEVGATSPAQFWPRHLQWWTQDAGRAAEGLRDLLRRSAARDDWGIRRRAEALESDPAVRQWVDTWTAVLARHLSQTCRQQVPRTTGHLVFHQAHMMLNRLGILPREEAMLGIIAASMRNETTLTGQA
ncbi:lantibiotic dehydratase C-terminal domain-containing protein [Streptomyces sp. NPDC057579]|uniref:lantibiotic dehydratase C-terminal domain-containing protein n=1 Tax=Streptomyces sp. NPDC057579 TaxID=3346172 RepID=UPI0036A2D771